MVFIKRFKSKFALVSVLFAFLIGGCVYYPPHHDPHAHADYYYDPHDYYFYPSVGVYFHFSTGYYYHHHHGRWIRTRVLPPHIRIHPRDRVHLKIKSKDPYLKHREHQKKYVKSPRPKYKVDERSNRQERESNRMRHEEYKRKRSSPGKKR